MVKTILFDFGNVVGFFDHQRAVEKLAAYTDMNPIELTLALYGGPIEDDYEHGHTTTAEYVRAALLNGRLSCTEDQFLGHFCDIFWRNDEICGLIPQLVGKYRLMLASNTNDAHYTKYRRQFADVLAHLDFLVTSHEARARKPHAPFFEYAQKHARAEPHECLFLDDMPVNVEAAEAFGWKGLVYRPDGTLREKLRAAGVEVGESGR